MQHAQSILTTFLTIAIGLIIPCNSMNQPSTSTRELRRSRGVGQQRVVTAARKEQNRLAQKIFRQRRRESHRIATDAANRARETNHRRELRPRQAVSHAASIGNGSTYSSDPLLETSFNDTARASGVFASLDEVAPSGLEPNHLAPPSMSIPDTQEEVDLDAVYEIQAQAVAATCNNNTGTHYHLPSPLASNLQFKPVALFTAMMQNAMSLGFDLEKMMTPGYISPFYRRGVTSQEDPSNLLVLSSVSSPFCPADLRPTLPQILYPHHPYLDLLPYPELRSKLITFTACRPRVFDLMDFKRDVYIHGGLVCWESSHGGSAQPWDVRSWEAAPWFLEKWRVLLADGGRNEIFTGSAWWRVARGSA